MRTRLLVLIAIALVVGAACSGDDDDTEEPADDQASETTTTGAPPETTTTTTVAALTAADLCAAAAPVQLGALQQPEVIELSGLEFDERAAPLSLVAHNDSGDSARYFTFSLDGTPGMTVDVANAVALDWEDMTATEDSLYFGDIGDNFRVRTALTVYRVPNQSQTAADAEAIELTFPDGAHDAEALMADPVDGLFVIVTKEPAGNSGVYVGPLDTAGPLELVATLNLGDGQLATAGDISADGSVIVVRTYTNVFVWDRRPGETLTEAFAREPCAAPAPAEAQGEAITLLPDGYITISEGEGAAIWAVQVGG